MAMQMNILVMDDEPLVRLMVCSRLEQAGAIVSEAGSCSEALDLALKTRFDVAVFDYRLPDGDGLTVVRRMRDAGIECPVVMLSGESTDIEKQAAEIEGICAVLPKPPDPDAILQAAEAAVGSRMVSKTAPSQVGRYQLYTLHDLNEPLSSAQAEAEWLAVDCSALDEGEPGMKLLAGLRKPRRGVAVVGAGIALRRYFEAQGLLVDYVADLDELAALSRHPSSPSERDFLMEAIVQRK